MSRGVKSIITTDSTIHHHTVLLEKNNIKVYYRANDVKSKALSKGALGCGISGSGPSIFALSKGLKMAKEVELSISEIYSKTGIEFYTFISKINTEGIKVI